jgi:hypothetical protein
LTLSTMCFPPEGYADTNSNALSGGTKPSDAVVRTH